jgi:hypothetical protein
MRRERGTIVRSRRRLNGTGRPLKLDVRRMAAQQKDDVFSRRYHRHDPWLKKIGYFRRNSFVSLLAAILIGLGQMYVLVRLWGHLSMSTPVPNWFHALGLKGSALHIAVFFSDALCNTVVGLPAAYLICKLKPPMLFVYLVLAIAPSFIWQYRLFFVDPTSFRNWTLFVPGLLLTLAPLPLAALAIRSTLSRRSPNQRLERP